MASFPPLTSLTPDNTSLQDPEMNCSEILVKSNPGEMVREVGPKILILYGYALLVVLVTFILQFKYCHSPVLLQRSENVRYQLKRINKQYFLLAFFVSISVFLPGSHEFSIQVLRVVFGLGMVNFLQLTMLQLGGEVKLMKKGGVEVKLGSVPFCCLAPFTISKRPLTTKTIYLVTNLINQVPYVQFTILYVNMSMELSNVVPNALHIFLAVIQTINWLGGIWGLMMLAGMVGNTLDSTQWAVRQKLVATLALIIWVIALVRKMILHLDAVLCMSPLLPPANIVVLGESCLILLLCLLCAGYQFRLYNRHSVKIDADQEENRVTGPSGPLHRQPVIKKRSLTTTPIIGGPSIIGRAI